MNKTVKNTVLWTNAINDLSGEETVKLLKLRRVKVELDLSNYAKKKTDLKNATGVDTSKYDKKS